MHDRAGIIVIGNEVLSGKVEDVNSTWLLAELRELGVEVEEVAIIPDVVDTIRERVRDFSARFDEVFTTGGVGPTHDDKTFAAIALAFGLELEENEALLAAIRAFFGPDASDAYLAMAKVPRGTELVWSDSLPFPTTLVRNVWVMPGDPAVMRKKFRGIRERFRQAPFHLSRIWVRLDEGPLSALLAAVEAAHEGVSIGSYPVYGNEDFRVQITVESRDRMAVESARDRLLAGIPAEQVWRWEGPGTA